MLRRNAAHKLPPALDFGPTPEGAPKLWPEHKQTEAQTRPNRKKQQRPSRVSKTLKPIKEESPQSSGGLNRLKERRRIQGLQSHKASGEGGRRCNGGGNFDQTGFSLLGPEDGLQRHQMVQEPGVEDRGATISSFVKRFRESPPLPKSQRSALMDIECQSREKSVFWWTEVEGSDSPKQIHQPQKIPLDAAPSSTPNFFDCDSAALMEADSVLERSKQVLEEDSRHKEMLDKLMGKYMGRGQAGTMSPTEDGISLHRRTSSDQAGVSFWDDPKEEDILEKWRRKCKSEIDISSSEVSRGVFDGCGPFGRNSTSTQTQDAHKHVSHQHPSFFDFKDGFMDLEPSQSNMFPLTNDGMCRFSSLQTSLKPLELGQPGALSSTSLPLHVPDDSQALLKRCRDLWGVQGSPMELDLPDSMQDIALGADQGLVGGAEGNMEGKNHTGGNFMHQGDLSIPSISFDKTPERQTKQAYEMLGSPMDVDDVQEEPVADGVTKVGGVSFFIPLGRQSLNGLPPLPNSQSRLLTKSTQKDQSLNDLERMKITDLVSTLIECTITTFMFPEGISWSQPPHFVPPG